MNFTIRHDSPFDQPLPALLLYAFQNEHPPLPAGLRAVIQRLTRHEFDGSDRQIHLLSLAGVSDVRPPRVFLLGLGHRQDYNPEKLRQVTGLAIRRSTELGLDRLGILLPADLSDAAATIVESVILANYRFADFKAETNHRPVRAVSLFCATRAEAAELPAHVATARQIAESTNYTRALANLPPNVIYPASLAQRARQLARQFGLRCRLYNRRRLHAGGFGGLLAVGGGSAREPYLIVLEYRGGRAGTAPFAVVGKAITFDTGGLSLKPAEHMDEMKFDKAGGCAVLGILRAAAALKLPVNVLGIIAAAENMPSATSYRPGDIITSYRGRDPRAVTVEVVNTDAEGRIVLGDALVYARQQGAAAIVDLATLTGACKVALGEHAAGLIGNNESLIDNLRQAGERTGERCWPLPLWPAYRDMINSDVADHKNISGRYAGAITAAAFLERYVGQTPWAHLDICGTAWTTDHRPCAPKGATGYGVRLLIEVLRRWSPR